MTAKRHTFAAAFTHRTSGPARKMESQFAQLRARSATRFRGERKYPAYVGVLHK
jgi:hypothetical protein